MSKIFKYLNIFVFPKITLTNVNWSKVHYIPVWCAPVLAGFILHWFLLCGNTIKLGYGHPFAPVIRPTKQNLKKNWDTLFSTLPPGEVALKFEIPKTQVVQ